MWYSDGSRYRGEWIESAVTGYGVSISNGSTYSGHFANGVPDGHGVFSSHSGTVYEGGWAGGLRHGAGVYRWGDGVEYRGGFETGLQHGCGWEGRTDILARGLRYTTCRSLATSLASRGHAVLESVACLKLTTSHLL